MTMKINKYKVSQELMNEIDEWRYRENGLVIGPDLNFSQPSSTYNWWLDNDQGVSEKNNRLIALIQYVNGEEVFEVEKPKKWVVRSKDAGCCNEHQFLVLTDRLGEDVTEAKYAQEIALTLREDSAFKFNTREEAKQFTNPLMEVVEWEEIAEGEFEDREFLELWEVEDD